jgi:hypothetical protein
MPGKEIWSEQHREKIEKNYTTNQTTARFVISQSGIKIFCHGPMQLKSITFTISSHFVQNNVMNHSGYFFIVVSFSWWLFFHSGYFFIVVVFNSILIVISTSQNNPILK